MVREWKHFLSFNFLSDSTSDKKLSDKKRSSLKALNLHNRTGGVLMIVMVVMIVSALMASQGVRLMMLASSAHDGRMRSAQINELLELGRQRLADQAQPETFTVEVPSDNGQSPRVGQVTIEKKSDADASWRIRVRFPYNQPQEMTVTWESPS